MARRKKAGGMPKNFTNKTNASSEPAVYENNSCIKERKPLIPRTPKTSSEQSNPPTKTEKKKTRMGRKKNGRSNPMASGIKTMPTANNQGITEYHMILSRQRLLKVGFHPSVTSKTPEEVEQAWLWRIDRLISRPTREQYMGQVQIPPNDFCIPSKNLTTAMFLLRNECDLEAKNLDNKDDNILATIFNTVDIGGEVAKHVFGQGWKSVFNTAVTSSSVWQAIANTSTIWDFYASDLRADGKSGVLLVVTPECTIGELNVAHDLDPYSMDPTNVLSNWVKEAMKCEREIFLSIRLIHDRINGKTGRGKGFKRNPEAKKIIPVEFMADKIVSAVKNIRQLKGLWGSSQFTSSSRGRLFEPSAIFAAKRLKMMLNHISTQRTAFQVLYFQKVPLLDRRMIAVILRACPNVRMLGIYDCPLIHFGDVLCLVDLIYEVNYERRQAGLAEIEGFDFYPRYNCGTPFETETSGTYGLTWGPHDLDVVQRGFFNILLKAFMKAKRMKLNLLFDKDKAFCAYLHQVPLPALAVPTFLDALYRYMEVRDQDSKKKALYDLLKPVRLGLVFHMDRDWPKFYANVMGRNLMFCSSCGYEVLEQFFPTAARGMQPHRRVCAGCTLQRWLDEEDDHLKEYKKQALDTLYPGWKGLEFNTDAPLPRIAIDIIKLRSTTAVRSNHNTVLVDSDGVIYGRDIVPDVIRDNKIQMDSLQNLPGLSQLLSSGRTWGSFYNNCNNLDVYSRAVHRIHEENEHEAMKKPFLRSRFDGGMPDTADELQPPRHLVPGIPSHDISSAFVFHLGLTKKGWGASEPGTAGPGPEPQWDLPVFNEGFW